MRLIAPQARKFPTSLILNTTGPGMPKRHSHCKGPVSGILMRVVAALGKSLEGRCVSE